jgi:hypothetical protein
VAAGLELNLAKNCSSVFLRASTSFGLTSSRNCWQKYHTGKSQYQALKKDLEKLSGEPGSLYFGMCFRYCSTSKSFPSSGAASLISLLDTQLANSVPASEIGLLKQKHEWELRALQA